MLLLTTPTVEESPSLPETPATASRWMPAQAELAALGPVLCTWRRNFGSELQCVERSCMARACVNISPLGLSEWIDCLTATGHCCMRLHPLPNTTQQHTWVRLMERLPNHCTLPSAGDACTRLLARLGDWLRGDDWKWSVLAFSPGPRTSATLMPLGHTDAVAARAILALHAVNGLP